jgi:hypothetical protein
MLGLDKLSAAHALPLLYLALRPGGLPRYFRSKRASFDFFSLLALQAFLDLALPTS